MPESQLIFRYDRYPFIQVKFYYKEKKTPIIDALLDSGGDFIVIPLAIAQYLNLKLKKAGTVDTAGGATPLFKTTVNMSIEDSTRNVLYANIQIHVSARNDIPVLLGRKPIFEDYEIIFKKQKQQLILNPIKKQNF